MAIDFFTADKIDFRVNERRQYERIKANLIEELSSLDDRYCIIVDYIIANQQYDIIVFKKDAIISIDLKGYKGVVHGSENGIWEVETATGLVPINQDKNPFQQAKDHRFALMRYLNERLPNISPRFSEERISNISSVVCFEAGSTYNKDQIDIRNSLWFFATDETNLVDLIRSTSSRQYMLKDAEIDIMLSQMNLQKLDTGKSKKVDVSTRAAINAEDIRAITDAVSSSGLKNGFSLSDLAKMTSPEVAVRYLSEATSRRIIVKSDAEGQFILSESWAQALPAQPTDEECENVPFILTGSDILLRPNRPEELKEYEGIYRGTTYHVDCRGKVWWQAGAAYPRLGVQFEDPEVISKILLARPQGGSFRITESKEILTKVFDEDKGYIPVYIGKLEGDIVLEKLKWKPGKMKPGSLWPGLYDGTKLSVNTGRQILIHTGGYKLYAKEGHEDLAKMVLRFNGRLGGGSFRINENGAVIALLYRCPYPEMIQEQLGHLTSEEKNIIDIRNKLDTDQRVPIYVGEFKGNLTFRGMVDISAEWTEADEKSFIERIGGL
jgi:hypothetical protein